MTRHLLTLSGVTPGGVAALLDLAADIKARPRVPEYAQALCGRTLGMLFDKHSTRTRISFEVAMNQLGGAALLISTQDSQLGRGESVSDTARTLSRYVDGLMIRTFGHPCIEEWAQHSSVPVINGLTDLAHPCQALGDLLTIRERFGALKGREMAYVGDGNNVVHSLMEAAALTGMTLRVATPPGYAPAPEVVRTTARLADSGGGRVSVGTDPFVAVTSAQVVYTDVWASMGQEASAEQRKHEFERYQVNGDLLGRAAPDAIFMHCLPAYRGLEVSAEVMDGPRSAVFDQAENRLHIQKAILLRLLTGAGI
ncbi:MAG: ornithine carbamoyltransferase [Nitrospirota bacterium]|nr:ornithine carbamoyltransferase [Nitrospirota bacterium]